MKRLLSVKILAMFLLLAGCGSGSEMKSATLVASSPPFQPVKLETRGGAGASEPAPGAKPSAAVRMVIRTANLSLIVDDAAASIDRAVAIVEKHGGYVADTRRWRDFNQVRATATLRIPAESLNAAIQEIRKDAIRVMNEAVNGQDVSEEYADLGAQLTNLRATETELRQLLATVRERTQKASEVLEVFSQLQKVRTDIERLQGRVDYLKQMTAMSTIQLELIPDQLSEPIVEAGWRPVAIVKNAARSLVVALKGIATALIWLVVYAVPLLALLGLLLFVLAWITRPIRRRLQPSKPSVQAG